MQGVFSQLVMVMLFVEVAETDTIEKQNGKDKGEVRSWRRKKDEWRNNEATDGRRKERKR